MSLALLDESLRLHTEAVDAVGTQLDAQSACSDYTALALINHCILTLHSFAAPLDGGPSATIPEIIGAADVTGGDAVGQTKAAVERTHVAYAAADPEAAKEYNLGPLPVGQAMAILTMQNLIHAWDLQRAVGGTVVASDGLLDLVEAVAAQLVPNVPPGLFAAPVETDAAGRLERLVALTGRAV